MDPKFQRPEDIPPPLEPAGLFTGVKLRPLIAGVIVDYVATFLAGIAYFMISFGSEPIGNGEIPQAEMERFLSAPENLFILGVLGTLCTVLGGFVAGRVARDLEVKHGALVGAGSILLAALEQVLSGGPSSFPRWYLLLGYAVAIPAGMLGGYLAQRVGKRADDPFAIK